MIPKSIGLYCLPGINAPCYPWIPYFALIASGLSCLLIWFDPQQRIALYCTIPFVALCYLFFYITSHR